LKCTPEHPPAQFNEFFVTRRTNRVVLLRRAEALLAKPRVREVVFHAMGAAVFDCCQVANELVRRLNGGTESPVTTPKVPEGATRVRSAPLAEKTGPEKRGSPALLRRVVLRSTTSTVRLMDELEPIDGTILEPLIRIRYNSAVHLRVCKATE
jgi:hypothetical protein